MATLRVRSREGDEDQPILLWDSVWFPQLGMADWQMAGPEEKQNRGGLKSRSALHTSVMISLFTDKRMPEGHPMEKYIDPNDRRGWWGDVVDVRDDLSETEMGSLLWALERTVLNEEVRKFAEFAALDALSPLLRQGAVAKIEADAFARYAAGSMDLAIVLFGRDGQKAYSERFNDIWAQTATAPKPQPFPQYPP